MSDHQEFLAWVHRDLIAAERALFNGDDGPRRAIWSSNEPVSVLGAWRNGVGRAELVGAFEELTMTFSNCTSYALDLISSDVVGDMAFTAGYERISCDVDGKPRTMTVRATQVYRREDGVWHVVHRHADPIG